jgi:16S rRNA (uracil1498-N3)-methyltransferase
VISEPDPGGTKLRIKEVEKDFLKREFHLHLGIAPTKSHDRFELFLEKATEIGIEEITPLLCERSERKYLRYDRLNKILLAAMKQSGRAFQPKLNPMVPLSVFMKNAEAHFRYIAHCRTDPGLYPVRPGENDRTWIVMIGPEGDFSEDEVGQALNNGFREVSLGEAVYRTETAGIMACQMIRDLHFLV